MLTPIIDKESILQFANWQLQCNKFVIIGHVNPDGDAVGSALALAHYLRSMGKRVWVMMPNPYPDYLKWMPGAEHILCYSRCQAMADSIIRDADAICCLDFNQLSRIGLMGEVVRQSKARKLLLDHHLGPEPFADICISHPSQSSTCELLFRFLVDLGHERRMNSLQATCLYTGMMTDTGAFSYNSNSPELFYIVSRLLQKGIDKDLIYRKVNYNYSASRLALQGQVLSGMEVFPEHHAAILKLSREQMRQHQYIKGDTEGFVNIPLQIKEVIFTIFLREDTEHDAVRVSLRSIGDFPANEVAAELGGGGHKNASGCEIKEVNVEQATQVFKDLLEKYKPLLQECYDKHPK